MSSASECRPCWASDEARVTSWSSSGYDGTRAVFFWAGSSSWNPQTKREERAMKTTKRLFFWIARFGFCDPKKQTLKKERAGIIQAPSSEGRLHTTRAGPLMNELEGIQFQRVPFLKGFPRRFQSTCFSSLQLLPAGRLGRRIFCFFRPAIPGRRAEKNNYNILNIFLNIQSSFISSANAGYTGGLAQRSS